MRTLPRAFASAIEPAAATASPEAVVRAYVAAVNRHDETAAYALTTASRAATARSAVDGVRNVVSISDLMIDDPRSENAAGTAAQGYREVVFVPVTFTVHQRRVASRPDGRTVWGYVLVRNRDTDPWRIADEGPV